MDRSNYQLMKERTPLQKKLGMRSVSVVAGHIDIKQGFVDEAPYAHAKAYGNISIKRSARKWSENKK